MRINYISNSNFSNITIDTNWIGEQAPYTKIISITGLQSDNIVSLYPIWSDNIEVRKQERKEYNKISMIEAQDDSIKLTCDEEKPTISLNVRLGVE